jgi:DmsE family decaheme c-type cytochrome
MRQRPKGEKMQRTLRSLFAWLQFSALALAGAFFVSDAVAQAPAASAPGSEVCQNCHAEQVATYKASVHSRKGDSKAPVNNGECSACHGNGTEHVKAGGGRGVGGIINPSPRNKSMSAEEKSNICLSCHSTNRHLSFWQSGQHRKNDVTCSNCHNPHTARDADNDKMLRADTAAASPYRTTVRQLAFETCVACHREQRAQILKPSHHPIVEGKVQCHSCHEPHGALTPNMIKAESVQDLCLGCHADKRGPWIHEHPPVQENCATCHTPHGSAHNRLLAQKPPALCADCHPGGHTHGLYDGRGTIPGVNPSNIRFEGSGCVNCHRMIHGSNAPASAFGQFFMR